MFTREIGCEVETKKTMKCHTIGVDTVKGRDGAS